VVFARVAAGVALVYYVAPKSSRCSGSTCLVLPFSARLDPVKCLVDAAECLGAEMNAVIEHASPMGKDPGEKVPGQRERKAASSNFTNHAWFSHVVRR
jgi:hypothetical protein